jgi:hypothetical protein
MASELLQRDPAEQSPDKAKKEAEVNELLQQASPFIISMGWMSIGAMNPPCSQSSSSNQHLQIRRVESKTRVTPPRPSVDVVLGSQWGDEGKGKVCAPVCMNEEAERQAGSHASILSPTTAGRHPLGQVRCGGARGGRLQRRPHHLRRCACVTACV